MKRGMVVLVIVLALVGIVGPSAAIAQDVTIVNLPFKFTVGNKVLNPGRYELRLSEDRSMITLTPEKGSAMMVPTITRLAIQQPITDGKVIFDRVGEEYYLSEVWLPEEDGFLVRDTKQPHKHHTVNAEKKKTF